RTPPRRRSGTASCGTAGRAVAAGCSRRGRGSTRRGRPSSARALGRTPCPSSRSRRRDGRCASGTLEPMRTVAVFLLAFALAPAALAANCPTVSSGSLTVGTDNPAYPPWFGGSEGHGWKVSDPTSGEGYESAVAYAVAA